MKRDNLDELMPIVRLASELGVGVNFSLYTDFKNGNRAHLVQNGKVRQAEEVVRELLAYKRARRGVITNSDYYLEQIPLYLRGERREPCRSGIRTIHLDPAGNVKRCPDFPTDFHWSQFRAYDPIDCDACWYACKGESEAPLRLSRVRDVMAKQRPGVGG
jgi:MoaA/NifB/PqqE/SkfB family radical SAM enzyme